MIRSLLLVVLVWCWSAEVLEGMDSCSNLTGREISKMEIALPTRGATVRSAKRVHRSDKAFCRIRGEVRSVDPSANPIRFELNLPENWNGKAVQFGGGVFDGWLGHSNGRRATVVSDRRQPTPLAQGYATFGSDSGHHHHYLFLPDAVNVLNAKFALNDEQRRNFASDSLKKTHDAAVALIRARYGTGPRRMYFTGGSTGGREAMKVVDRWPEDYDGVLAAYAAWNQIESDLQFIRIAQAMYARGPDGQRGWLPPSKARLLRDAVLNACDAKDGLKDGIISDPNDCHFDAATLRCSDGKPHKRCLSDGQERTVAAFAEPHVTDFAVQNDIHFEPGFNVLRGASLAGNMGLLRHPMRHPALILNSFYYLIGDGVGRFFLTKDPHFNVLTLDTKTGDKWVPDLIKQSAEDDGSLADLSAFERRGGKLLLVHGTYDTTIPTASVFLYQRIVEAMGQERVHSFVRLYVIPGYGHEHGVFKAGFDTMGVLDAWADKGIAPERLVVSDGNKGAARTRPLCEWPTWPKYLGGDANKAASFTCQ
jgi:feruloyl esterase